MRPAFSVIFLTTLIGVGQGVYLALYAAEIAAALGWLPAQPPSFFTGGSFAALVLLAAGLVASFFHLGRPERAWRAAACWRTSWLSREVIVLPLFMALVAVYAVAHYAGVPGTRLIGAAAVLACMALFVCTGMIYACIRFLQEWATPLTVVNFTLLGSASGFTFAAGYAAFAAQALVPIYGACAIVLTALGLCARGAALLRQRQIRPASTLQTAIGIKHPRIEQKAQGFMGGSFNTREFRHGRASGTLRAVRWWFLLLAFAVPIALLATAITAAAPALAALAFAIQFVGLIAERWSFFAEARHPQNLYYGSIA
ncbi:MAG TPA: DmsC/YnfH family molybdoenzyme membrane anchor subunit [Burkholderiales bacterium]|nr:DmsC/YnfH family molybdoenzyme membrane anchor subunit [Burkholderiales bacterium]